VSGPAAVFDAATGRRMVALAGHQLGTTALAWRPGHPNTLATAGQDGVARLWDARAGREYLALDGGAAWVEHLAWNPDGTMLATAAGRTVRVWDAAGRRLAEYPNQLSTVAGLAWRPGANSLAVLVYGGVGVWNPGTPTAVKRFPWKGSPLALAWSPDGAMLAHGNQDSTVHFWYYDSGRDLQMWGYPTKVRELAWDPTSRLLATGGGPEVTVWDCGGKKGPEGTKPAQLAGHGEDGRVTALAYQPGSPLLASGRSDGGVVLWRSPAADPLAQADAGGEVTALQWLAGGKGLVAGTAAGAVLAFDAR
jgi:WD40 repeat protein